MNWQEKIMNRRDLIRRIKGPRKLKTLIKILKQTHKIKLKTTLIPRKHSQKHSQKKKKEEHFGNPPITRYKLTEREKRRVSESNHNGPRQGLYVTNLWKPSLPRSS